MNQNFKILVIDDEVEICKVITKSLTDIGFSVDEVHSIETAKEYLAKCVPNLIILDKYLPDGDGFELTKELSVNRKFDTTYILLMSGKNVSTEDQLKGIEYGAVDFITKPIRPDTLRERVKFIFRVIQRETEKRNELEKLNNKLYVSEKRFNNLLENYPNGMITVFDRNYRFFYADGKELNKLNLPKNKIIGRTVLDVFPKEVAYKLMAFYDGVWRGNNIEFEYEFNKQTYYCAAAPIKNDQGIVNQILVITQNITDMRNLQDKVQKSEERYKTFFENDLTGDYLSTPENGVIDCNQAFIDMLGYSSKDEVLTLDPNKLYPSSDDRTNFLQKLAKEKIIRNSEFVVITKEGSKRRVIENVIGVFNEQDELYQFYGYMYDITEIRKAQEALEVSEEKYRGIFENSALGIFRSTPDGKYEEVNEAFANILGFNSPEKMLTNVDDISQLYKHPEDRDKIVKEFAKVGFVENYEIVANHPFKETCWISINARADLNSEGEVFYEGTIQNITEKKLAEDALRKSETFLSSLLESMPIPVFYKNTEGKYEGVNQAFEEFFGGKQTTLIGKSVFDLYPKKLAEIYYKKDKSLFENGGTQIYESEIETAKGEIRSVIFNKAVYRDNSGKINGLIGAILDITERKKAEEELRESKENISRILENSIDGILLTAPDGSIYSANPAACRIFGRSEEELCKIGRENVVDFSDPNFHEWLKIRKKEGKVRGEVTLLRNDGIKFPAEVSSALFSDKDGNVKSSMIVRDISDRKKAENEIKEKINELQRHNRVMVGREKKMIQLKGEINELCEKLNMPKKYSTPEKLNYEK